MGLRDHREEAALSLYRSLCQSLRDMEKSLAEDETIMFSGNGPNSREAYLNQIIRRGDLLQVVGTSDNNELVILTFAPEQFSIQMSSVTKPGKKTAIGFEQFD